MKRQRLAALLDFAHIPAALLALRARGGSPWINVVTYHRIGVPSGDLDHEVIDATPDAFERQVAFMTRWFHVIGIDDLVAFTRGASLPKNPILITFDDGYRDNHDIALPILTKYGARATFFVATKFLSERRLFWWDKIAVLVKRSTCSQVELEYPARVSLPFGTDQERRAVQLELLRIVKKEAGLDVDRFLTHAASALGVTLSRDEERALADRSIMTWDHARAMSRAGMDVQSHTVSHRVLETLDDAALASELRDSRVIIEREIGLPVRALAYPVGRAEPLPSRIRSAVKEAGYDIAFENATGADLRWTIDPLNVKRFGLDLQTPDSFFRSMMALPPLAY